MHDGSVGSSPGWYPDPTGRHDLRYHNGASWTGDVSTDGIRRVSPWESGTRARSATVALVLGIVSMCIGWIPFVSFFAIGAGIAAIVLGFRRRANPDVRSAANAAIVTGAVGLVFASVGTWLAFVVVDAVSRYEDPGAYRIDGLVCAETDGITRANGTITNLTDGTRSYTIAIAFDDERSRTIEVDDVEAGGAVSFVVDEDLRFDELSCTIDAVNGPRPFGIDIGP